MDQDLEEEILEIIKILNKQLNCMLPWPDPKTLGLVLVYKGAEYSTDLITLLNNEWLKDPEENIIPNPNLKWDKERRERHSLKMKELHASGRYKKNHK